MVRCLRSVLYASVVFAVIGGVQAGPVSPDEGSGITGATPAVLSAAYRDFHARVVEISKLRLDQPKNVVHAQKLLVAPNEAVLSRGWVAAFAEVASRSEKFSEGVKAAAARAGGSDKLVAKIKADPNFVLEFEGAQSAEKEVMAAIAQDSVTMGAVTYRLNEIAYGRTSKEAGLALQAQNGDVKGVTGATAPRGKLSPRATPLMAQILALGAAINLSKDGNDKALSRLTANQENDQCLRWARLNLAQCLAAAKDGQENAYCLAQHGLDERAKCWSWVAQPAS
jgi:hypothetical protein